MYFGGTLSLLLASLVLAFLAHNLPADLNDASFLLLSTCGITIFWIFLILAYYVSTSVRSDTLLALIITSQGLVTMLCLFTRRPVLHHLVKIESGSRDEGKQDSQSHSDATQLLEQFRVIEAFLLGEATCTVKAKSTTNGLCCRRDLLGVHS